MLSQYAIEPLPILISFLLFLFLSYTVLDVYKGGQRLWYPRSQEQSYYRLTCALLILYCVFAYVDGDFYHYYEAFDKIKRTGFNTNFEPVHFEIIKALPANYYLWRLIIWGVASVLTLKAIKKLGLDIKIATCFIALIYLSYFSVMRGTLGISIMFFGYSLLLCKGSRWWGIFLIAISLFFHRSMLMSIAILPLSFIRLKKKYVIASVILFPVLITVIPIVIEYVLAGDFLAVGKDLKIAESLETYSEGEVIEHNFLGKLIRTLYYFPIVFSLIYVVKHVTFKNMELPTHIYRFYVYWYIMSYIAYLFFFQEMSSFLFERFLIMSYFPLVVVLSYFYKNHKMTSAMRLIIGVALFSCFYRYLYVFYSYL